MGIGLLSLYQLGRKYPTDSRIAGEIYGNVLMRSKLDFKPIPGRLGYRSELYSKGFLSGGAMPCYVLLYPEFKRLSLTYVPKHYGTFAARGDVVLGLCNWINARIKMGRFVVRRPAEQRLLGITVRHDLVEPAFDLSLYYADLSVEQIKAWVSSYLTDLIWCFESFHTLIEAASHQAAEIDSAGEVVGKRASEAIAAYQKVGQPLRDTSSVNREQVLSSITSCLSDMGFLYESIACTDGTTYRLEPEGFSIHPSISFTAHLTPDLYLLLESSYHIPEGSSALVATSRYLGFVNSCVAYGGAMYTDEVKQSVIHRTSIDALAMAGYIDANVLATLVAEQLAIGPWLLGAKLTAHREPAKVVVRKVIDKYLPDSKAYIDVVDGFVDHMGDDGLSGIDWGDELD